MRSWGEVGTRMVFMAAASPCYLATRIGPFAAPLRWTQAPPTASLFARQAEAPRPALSGARRRQAGIVGRRDEGGVPGVVRERAGRGDEAAGAAKRTGRELQRQEAVALIGPGEPERAGLIGREAEAGIVGRVADEKDGGVAERLCARKRLAHQLAAEAEPLEAAGDGNRAEEERRTASPGRDLPQPHRADERAVMLEHEGQAVGRLAAFAQALAGLAKAVVAEQGVEQRLAGTDVGRKLFADREHGRALPMSRGVIPDAGRAAIRDLSTMRWNQIPALRLRCGRDDEAAGAAPSDHVALQRREAVEGDRRVGRRIGAGALDQDLVADLE